MPAGSGEQEQDRPDGAPPELDLVEEAKRIAGVVQDWLEQGTSRLADAEPEPAEGHRAGPDCEWCPLCRLAAALRAERPEIREKIAEAAAALSSVVRSLMDAAAAHSGAEHSGAEHSSAADSGAEQDEPAGQQARQPEQERRPRPGPRPAGS